MQKEDYTVDITVNALTNHQKEIPCKRSVKAPLNIREKVVGWSHEQGKGRGGRSGKK
jgi:hypothetical protein